MTACRARFPLPLPLEGEGWGEGDLADQTELSDNQSTARSLTMERKQGKFTLFDAAGFKSWLSKQTVSRQITLVQNHHTYIPGYKHFKGDNHFALQTSMESSHRERGFAEIAQHFTTFPDGTVITGRSLEKIPAGIKGANTGAICIEHLGNFDQGGDVMTTPQRELIIAINALLCHRFRLAADTDHIVYHHWYDLNSGERRNGAGSTKSCPGSAFFGGNKVADAEANFLPSIRTELDAMTAPKAIKDPLWRGRVINTESLNVRDTNAASGKKIKALPAGVVVGIYSEKDGWAKIDPKASLWVSKKYLELVA